MTCPRISTGSGYSTRKPTSCECNGTLCAQLTMKMENKIKRFISKSPLKHWYLLVKIEFLDSQTISAANFKSLIIQNLKRMYGEIGAATNIYIRKFFEKEQEAILMVPNSHVIHLWTSLITISDFYGTPCSVRILQTSQHLISIGSSSRQLIYST
ncbi:unnamed protein product [Acanthosepion pharaonis]|uniref:Uncharacterized protein n=1 Tax=Acanthosepion pharaonis TaxID=158019 RepID=A0A812BQ05_ACAPH|nr:unnamed protein product [Sepia pharaonis]